MTLRFMTFFRQEAGDKPTMACLANLSACFAEGAVKKDCVRFSAHHGQPVPAARRLASKQEVEWKDDALGATCECN